MKITGIVAAVLLVIVVVMLLTGHGPGRHMSMGNAEATVGVLAATGSLSVTAPQA